MGNAVATRGTGGRFARSFKPELRILATVRRVPLAAAIAIEALDGFVQFEVRGDLPWRLTRRPVDYK